MENDKYSGLRPAARLHHRFAHLARIANRGLDGQNLQRHQRCSRHAYLRRTRRSIDDRRSANDVSTCFDQRIDRLARRSSGRDHVLDDKRLLTRRNRKTSAQRHLPRFALGPDKSCPKRARDFVPDHDSADRRGRHQPNPLPRKLARDRFSERCRLLRKLKH